MLASGADISLNSVEYKLATDEEEPYVHWYESLHGADNGIPGTDDPAVNPAIRMWVQDKFWPGHGQKFRDPENPDRYWSGTGNVRGFPGTVTSVPTRTTEMDTTLSATVEYDEGGNGPVFFCQAGANLWCFAGTNAYYSTDEGDTWTENTAVESLVDDDSVNRIVGVASDGQYPWFLIYEGGAPADQLYYCPTTSSVAAAVKGFGASGAETVNGALCAMGSKMYVFGQDVGASGDPMLLFEFDITDCTDGTAHTYVEATDRIYATGIGTTGQNTYNKTGMWIDLVEGDGAVYFFGGLLGTDTTVHEYRSQLTQVGAGRPVWNLPRGFSGQRLVYQSGQLLIAGRYNGLCALYGYDTTTKSTYFAGYIGEKDAVNTILAMEPSYGSEVMIACNDGTTNYVYIYDIATDSMSTLDSGAVSTLEALCALHTTMSRRLAAGVDDASTDFEIYSWSTDKATPAGAWVWESAAWDFDTPFDGKTLLGFHVIQDPAISGTVAVQYLLDEDTGTGYSTALTTVGGSKHTYLNVASGATKTFRTLRMKATGASGARMFSIAARAYVNTYQEMWRVKIRVDDETELDGEERIRDRARKASILRDALFTAAAAKTVITFLDGRHYGDVRSDTVNVGYKSNQVLVEDPADFIDSTGEGYFMVTLRSISP